MSSNTSQPRCDNTESGSCHNHGSATLTIRIGDDEYGTINVCAHHLVRTMMRYGFHGSETSGTMEIVGHIGDRIARDILKEQQQERTHP